MNDSGLWKRGLILFLVLAGISGVVLFIIFYRFGQSAPTSQPVDYETLAPMVCTPSAPFPASISWGTLYLYHQNAPSLKGWEIRYNATLALARRGSVHVPWDVMEEMLDVRQQMVNFRVRVKPGKFVNDEAAAHRTVVNALTALVIWQKEIPPDKKNIVNNAELKGVINAIEKLTNNSNDFVRTKAIETQKIFKNGE